MFTVSLERGRGVRSTPWLAPLICVMGLACQDPPMVVREGGPTLITPIAGQELAGMTAGGVDGGAAGEMAGDGAGEEFDASAGESIEMSDMAPPLDMAAFDPIPFAVETRVGERNTEAGIENRVTCQLLDQEAQPISAPNLRVEIVPSQGFQRSEIGVVGEVARTYELTCVAEEFGLVDSTPALWTVIPSAPALTLSKLVQEGVPVEQVSAGEWIEVECEAFDAFGNQVDAIFTERVEPQALGVDRIGARWRMNRSGQYAVYCDAPGVEDSRPSFIEVSSGLPRRLTLALDPDRPIYRAGQIVSVIPQAYDAQDNPVNLVEYQVSSDPALSSFGTRRFRLDTLGRFNITAEVTSPTEDDVELSASREILVDFAGPGIRCFSPEEGELVTLTPNRTVTLTGQASDFSGITSLTVDGQDVEFDQNGRFQAEVNAEWGLNIHEILATDESGESSSFCAYFASERFLNQGANLQDALLLYLGQGVVDDGPSDRPLRSVGDVLRRVVNSPGLRDNVHAAASAQNPLVPTECRARVLGICIFRFGVTYEDFQISRDNRLSLTLLDNALRVRVELRDIAVTARLRGTLGNRARISTSGITVDLTFNTELGAGGRPNISVRSLNEVTVNRLDSDFSGFITGFILELAFRAFEGLIRNTVTNTIRDFLQTQLDSTLTGLFSDTSVGELGSGFSIPHPLGGALSFQLLSRLSRLDWSPRGILLGLSTSFDGPDVIALNAPGIPLISESAIPFPNGDSVGASVKLSVLNQALYALWRAGYFNIGEAGLVEAFSLNLPAGSEITLNVSYPPFVQGVDGDSTIRVAIGPLTASVVYPGFFEEPFPLQLVAQLSARVSLQGERDLSFDSVEIENIVFSLGSSVPATARAILQVALEEVLQNLVDEALNSALPSLPIPELTIPAGLEAFELPPTTRLGLRSPSLSGSRDLWYLSGTFGEP